jgi:hypothetical protein
MYILNYNKTNSIMVTNRKRNENNGKGSFIITEKGSLGILALGDVGLRAWRKVKLNVKKEDKK